MPRFPNDSQRAMAAARINTSSTIVIDDVLIVPGSPEGRREALEIATSLPLIAGRILFLGEGKTTKEFKAAIENGDEKEKYRLTLAITIDECIRRHNEIADLSRRLRMKTWVKLYKDGDHMGIETNATDEREFWDSFCDVLASALKHHDGDEEFQLRYWSPQAFEVVAQLRGYKSQAVVTQIVVAGEVYGDKSQQVFEPDPKAAPNLKAVS